MDTKLYDKDEHKEIVGLTPFIYEDGNTYYFNIVKRDNRYHGLFAYEKIIRKRKKYKWKFIPDGEEEYYDYMRINNTWSLVGLSLNADEIKGELNDILRVYAKVKANITDIKGWDGFVGKISESQKKEFLRSNRINEIFNGED